MEFLFLNDKYLLKFEEDEIPYLEEKLDRLFTESISQKGEITADHIAGERDIDEEWREDMYLDAWILSIYPTKGQTMMFVKCMGEYDVTVRAIVAETGEYESFIMDVVDAVEVLEDFSIFVRPPLSPSISIENGFSGC
jgi:hypothetical protein